jgi:quercetin dioxygenase-like cupin family protein
MHRHPHCDQIVMVRRGHVVIYDEDTEITLGPDEAVVLPRNEFHALRALDEEAEILNLFPGVGDTTEAGYEVHPTTAA